MMNFLNILSKIFNNFKNISSIKNKIQLLWNQLYFLIAQEILYCLCCFIEKVNFKLNKFLEMIKKKIPWFNERIRSTKEIVDELFSPSEAASVKSFAYRIFGIPISKSWTFRTQIIVSLIILNFAGFALIWIVLGVGSQHFLSVIWFFRSTIPSLRSESPVLHPPIYKKLHQTH